MKNTIISFVAILVVIMIYLVYFNDNSKDVTIDKKEDTDKISKVQPATDKPKVSEQQKVVKDEASDKKDTIKESKTKIVTDSKVLKSLLDSLDKDDFDSFDKVYYKKINELREKEDHSEFYNSFKNLFLDNNFGYEEKIPLLALLRDTNTKDSLNLLFEIYDEGIISDHDVQFDVARHLLDSVSSMVYDPSIDFKEVIETLKKEYKKTEIKPLKEALGMMIARYDKGDKESMTFLFGSYINAKDDATKNAAYKGLMKMDGDKILPILRDYLGSDQRSVHKTAGEMLVNIGGSGAVEKINDWVLHEAKYEDFTDIKKWYLDIIKTKGKTRIIKSWDSRIDKIKDEALREEIKSFLDEQTQE